MTLFRTFTVALALAVGMALTMTTQNAYAQNTSSNAVPTHAVSHTLDRFARTLAATTKYNKDLAGLAHAYSKALHACYKNDGSKSVKRFILFSQQTYKKFGSGLRKAFFNSTFRNWIKLKKQFHKKKNKRLLALPKVEQDAILAGQKQFMQVIKTHCADQLKAIAEKAKTKR